MHTLTVMGQIKGHSLACWTRTHWPHSSQAKQCDSH